jgi:phage terminase small subunit
MDYFTTLTPKQARFCAEFFVDYNATAAALRAGYSPATAANGRLMTLPKIKQHLQQRGALINEELDVTHQMVLTELKKMAFANMGDYFGSDGKIKPMQEIGDSAKAALLNYTITEDKNGTTIKIRMSNKLQALEKIAKHIKFYDPMPQEVNYWIIDRGVNEECDSIDDDSVLKENQETRIKSQDDSGEVVGDHTNNGDEENQEARSKTQDDFAEQIVGGNSNNGDEEVKENQEARIESQDGFGQVVGDDGENTHIYPPVGNENQETRIKRQDGFGQVVGDNGENTHIYPPVGLVVGENTNNGERDNTSNDGRDNKDNCGRNNNIEIDVKADKPLGVYPLYGTIR